MYSMFYRKKVKFEQLMTTKLWTGIICLVICIFASDPSWAQIGTNGKTNMSTVRADDLSDDEIRSYMQQAESAKLSDDEIMQLAVAKGFPVTEAQKIMERVKKLRGSQPNKYNNKRTTGKTQQQSGRTFNTADVTRRDSLLNDSLTLDQKMEISMRKRIFGSEIFANKNITFEPNLRLATPANYQLGPDDQILIDVYGNSEANMELEVSPEGTINIPYVGVVSVGGLTVEEASRRIRSRMSSIYTALRSGQTKVNITLGNIRTIKVTVTGEVIAPATYSLPSLATVATALYSSGGPSNNGSFRAIEVVRGGRKIATLDVYDFIINGAFKTDVRLRDQDVILVPPYNKRVEVSGEVKRPRIFELLPGEKFSDLLRYAAGFSDNAYRARVKVLRTSDTQRRLGDLAADQFSTYEPAAGDHFFVDPVIERFENRVTIEGAVFRPGDFELTPGLTAKGLILKADGIKEDAFTSRATILRKKDNLQPELISFDIAQLLSGTLTDIPLKREDLITISSVFDLKEFYTVQIDGEVQRPGAYNYAEGMTLQDLILQAGNLREGATASRVEISRRVKNSNALSTSAQTSEVILVDISQDLKSSSAGASVLQPFDIVSVRPSPGYEVQRVVRVEGEVLYPGNYALTKKNERISDMIKRAGGFTAQAYADGASLKRLEKRALDTLEKGNLTLEQQNLEFQRLRNIRVGGAVDSLRSGEEARVSRPSGSAENYVGIDLPKILREPGQIEDIFLENGDILNIPKQLQTVTINGQVLSPRTVVYSKNAGFRDYISGAGGFSPKARKKTSYVQYANGSVKGTRKFLFFTSYPPIRPGAEIFVPEKENRRALSATEIVGLTSGLASLGAIVLGILNLSN